VKLVGRIALVTGGSRSIGRAVALGLARDGADVAVNYLSRAEAAESAVREIEALGRRAIAVRADTSQQAQVRAMVGEVTTRLGAIDILGIPPSSERAKTVPLGRLARPEDIANVVAFLASSEAAYMTGQAVNVTGGLWLH
jgi:3-oxoacyl-[acyl-carrier protein] reductase